MLEPPFADESLAADLYLLRCRRVDHVVVIGGDLVMQALWGMREKVSVLVNRAALDRRAVDDEELGSPQPAPDEIVEDSAPGLGALATHAPDPEQHLLAVPAPAQDHDQR